MKKVFITPVGKDKQPIEVDYHDFVEAATGLDAGAETITIKKKKYLFQTAKIETI
jgi:hypothetical protein